MRPRTNSKTRNSESESPPPERLAPVLDRNIEALQRRRQREERAASWQERLADAMTRFAGSMRFVYIHIAAFGFWIFANLNVIPGIPAWDASFVVLAMIASVEAIVLATSFLSSRTEWPLPSTNAPISTCRSACWTLLSDIAKSLGIKTRVEVEIQEVQQDVAPDAVLDEIEKRADRGHRRAASAAHAAVFQNGRRSALNQVVVEAPCASSVRTATDATMNGDPRLSSIGGPHRTEKSKRSREFANTA